MQINGNIDEALQRTLSVNPSTGSEVLLRLFECKALPNDDEKSALDALRWRTTGNDSIPLTLNGTASKVACSSNELGIEIDGMRATAKPKRENMNTYAKIENLKKS